MESHGLHTTTHWWLPNVYTVSRSPLWMSQTYIQLSIWYFHMNVSNSLPNKLPISSISSLFLCNLSTILNGNSILTLDQTFLFSFAHTSNSLANHLGSVFKICPGSTYFSPSLMLPLYCKPPSSLGLFQLIRRYWSWFCTVSLVVYSHHSCQMILLKCKSYDLHPAQTPQWLFLLLSIKV